MKLLHILVFSFLMYVMFVGPAYCQTANISTVDMNSELLSGSVHMSNPDSAAAGATILPDSSVLSFQKGWFKQPGEMPIFIPGILPNSIIIVDPPAVDQEMILPLNGTALNSMSNGSRDEDEE